MSKVVNTLDDPAKPPLLHPSGATEHGARGKVLLRGTIFDCGLLKLLIFYFRSENSSKITVDEPGHLNINQSF